MTWETDLQAAPDDPEAAARVLGHVAAFIRRGEVLPPALAEHVAGAFEDVARQTDRRKRADWLAYDLFLFGQEGRPRADVSPEQVFLSIAFGDNSKRAEWAALAQQHGVSVSTIRNRYDEWLNELSEQRKREEQWVNSLSDHELEAWFADPYDQGVQIRD